jgi:hypothetical protein
VGTPLSWSCAIVWGYVLSLGGGTIETFLYHWWTTWRADRFASRLENEPDTKKPKATDWGAPSIVTGMLERLVFTAFVILAPKEAIPAMGGWLTLKMAASWQRDRPENTRQYRWISFAFLGLQTGFLSMAFAAAGGLLARYLAGAETWPPVSS